MVKCDTALGLNDFYVNRNGEETLVSSKRNDGGFVTIVNKLDENEAARSTFEADMLITSCIRKEADEERQIPEKVVVKGAIFDFRKSLLPIEFSKIKSLLLPISNVQFFSLFCETFIIFSNISSLFTNNLKYAHLL